MPTASTFPFDRVRPIMLRVIIGALIAAALVSIVAILSGSFGSTSWMLVGTAFLFVAFALFTWYDASVSALRSATFAFLSFAVSVYLFIAGIGLVWTPRIPGDYDQPGFEHWLALAFIARVALLHGHLLLAIETKFQSALISAVTKVTLLFVVVLALLLSFAGINPGLFDSDSSPFWRLVAVIAILDALGTGLIPLGYSLLTHGRRVDLIDRTNPRMQSAPPEFPATPGFSPPGDAYVADGTPLRLAWPRYVTGAELPALPDGSPDFAGVFGYTQWRLDGEPRG